MATVDVKRRYDSSNRQRQAAQTHRRILHAAQALFLRDGYTATTMTAIAAQAGVAVQTVYASTHSKRDILQRILDLAASGEDEQVPVTTGSRWRELERQTDPRAKLALFSQLHTEICQREAAAFTIMTDAAGSDPDIRALLHETAQRRYRDQLHLARSLHKHGALKTNLTDGRAADIIWTLASERTYLALVHDRGWTTAAYSAWLSDQLTCAVIADAPRSTSAAGTEQPSPD